ncbi:hypothetical protein F4W67_06590 [Pseudomonas caricapapayae]|nr:hypothetical protein F4W67_06590 [Pseudomonas caricapapayae]
MGTIVRELSLVRELSFLALRVGMPWVTLRVTILRRAAPRSRQDAERPERRAHAEHGHDSQRAIVVRELSFLTLRVGMPWVTLRVTILRRAACSRQNAERP